jgi:uncharacterized protein
MKLGIITDTHNNIANTRWALERFRAEGVDRLIHCGDLTAPKMIEEFVGWQIDFVFGNNDDRMELRHTIRAMLPESAIDELWSATIDGVRLAAMHGDNERRLNELIRSGAHHYVFRGHSHMRLDQRIGGTRVINAGSLGGKRPQSRSICVLDVEMGEAKFIEVTE